MTTITKTTNHFEYFVAVGKAGRAVDVDTLMHALESEAQLGTTKLIDYALSLVQTMEGRQRIRHYLFNGTQSQRNYAALYFKRKGWQDLLDEAVALGKIDRKQAYLK